MIKTIKINKSFGENNNFEVIKNNQRNFIMIFGPPGSGKSVAGEHLKEKYNYLLFDSDLDRSDVEKMRLAHGEASTQKDRDKRFFDLIDKIKELKIKNEKIAVVNWLPVRYQKLYENSFPDATFVFIKSQIKKREERIQSRTNHFIKPEYNIQLTRMWGEPLIKRYIVILNDKSLEDLKARLDILVNEFSKLDNINISQSEINESKQIFPIFNPITENLIKYKLRSEVHNQGDWHKAIQAHIIRINPKNEDKFQILVQIRSRTVDINKEKIDQSLATQMLDIDQLNENITLKRGMKTELGVTNYQSIKLNIGNLRVIKTYREYPKKYNREIAVLYLIVLKDEKQITKASKKVKEIFWMNWEDFIKLEKENADNFTKTTQFYLINDIILSHIENLSYRFLGINNKSIVLKYDLSKMFFVYINSGGGKENMYVFKNKKDMQKNQGIFNLRENLLNPPIISP